MAAFPRFTFPLSREQSESSHSLLIEASTQTDSPPFHTSTNIKPSEDCRLVLTHNHNYSCAQPINQLSTPPASPSKLRISAMGMQHLGKKKGDRSLTPPPTPTGTSHVKTGSSSSNFLDSLSNLRRGDSVISSPTCQGSGEKPGSTEVITYPYHAIDYEFCTNAKGQKKIIGNGAWSNVYLATPSVPSTVEQPSLDTPTSSISPPLTPLDSRSTPTIPSLYAIKVPATTSAKKVLCAEAKILSYLSRFPNAHAHIVPFFGLDTRTEALVLKAMDGTLESWIAAELNTLSEPLRAQKLAAIFPTLALSLIDSLAWMQDKACIQADIKPSNILISFSPSGTPNPVYTDFSSAILTQPDGPIDSSTASPFGAGTWDYLDPKTLNPSHPATPSATTDLWSLAISLLYLVIGSSPYDGFRANKYQQREMIKSGAPLQCLGYGDVASVNMKRLASLSQLLGFGAEKWFAMVLVKDSTSRVGLSVWREKLVEALAAGAVKV
ncbi:hypothetical protein IAQ61_003148 [Plenodomus lingam]|uniref:uncharacterized protein n=1 Tax=Leptosphaeria maculans TaxID=5022 RepID=UPI003325948E|nr:hypothetical protein IAQ61_003148 [Plenodomus lingam]